MFYEWVLGVGDGIIGESNDVDIILDILDDLLIWSTGDPLAAIVDYPCPNILESMNDISYFQNRSIFGFNTRRRKIYLNYDTPYSRNIDDDAVDDVHAPEFLNTISASELPNHKFKLKVGVPVMLLWNIDQKFILCNGTRLIITRWENTYVKEKLLQEAISMTKCLSQDCLLRHLM